MNKHHICEIVPLIEQEWIKRKNGSNKSTIMVSPHVACIQVLDGNKYYEISNPGQRGGFAENGKKASIFDIAISYKPDADPVSKKLKRGYMSILREKIMNDFEVYRKLLEEMGINDEITMEEFSEFIVKKGEVQLALEKLENERKNKKE